MFDSNHSEHKQLARQRILDAAVQLFYEKGFKGTSVRDIAGAAQINISMISYYFNGKKGILKEIMEETLDDLDRSLHLDDLREDAEVMENLESLLKLVRRRIREIRILLTELKRNEEDLQGVSKRFKVLMEHVLNYYAHISGMDGDSSRTRVFHLVELVLGMILSSELMGLRELFSDEIAVESQDYDREKDKLILRLAEFILEKKEEFLPRLEP
jgi:AcrR family transcriptional regulator